MGDLIAFRALLFLSALLFIPQIVSSLRPPVHLEQPAVFTSISSPSPTPVATITVTPTSLPKPKTLVVIPTPTPDNLPWGVARQISEHDWVLKINNDATMGTPAEILQALNDLRMRYGAQPLKTDPRLCDYAQKRADYFISIKGTDEHKGLFSYLNDSDGYSKLGFGWIGENYSYGYVMSGVHLIEFVYNSDWAHSQNQLDPKWDHGCVGVNSPATDLIFATSPR
jgi:uncharacterized protein YkwD